MHIKSLKNTIEFNDFPYRVAHGSKPWGCGGWAFDFGSGVVFAPSSTYATAKKWIKAFVQQQLAEVWPAGASQL